MLGLDHRWMNLSCKDASSLFGLFSIPHHNQYLIGYIVMGSKKGKGTQYIQLVKVLYCKPPTLGKQLPAFPWGQIGVWTVISEMGGECVPTTPPCQLPPMLNLIDFWNLISLSHIDIVLVWEIKSQRNSVACMVQKCIW